MKDIFQWINSFFDFELEDQPDKLADYASNIDHMWTIARREKIVEQVILGVQELVASSEPEILMNSMFLPGKHDTRQILQLVLSHATESH